MAILKRRKDNDAVESSAQEVDTSRGTAHNTSPQTTVEVEETPPPTPEPTPANKQQDTPVEVTSVAGNPIGLSAPTPKEDVTVGEEVTPTSTTEEVKEETPTETITEKETEKEPESTPEPATEPEAEPEAPATPADNGMPQRGTRFEDEARANAPTQYTQEELDKAKKRGKRESRMATAGHIMDTLARVLNFAATTKGAPSAKWSNRNVEVDKDTYYNRMKKENEEARKNYFNMMLAGAGQDTKDYATALSGWREGNKEKREAELQPHKIAEIQGKANKANAEAAVKAIEAQYAPKQNEAKLRKLQEEAEKARKQGNAALASAANSAALAELHRSQARKGEYHFMGVTYYNEKDWQKAIDKAYEGLPEDDDLRQKEYKDKTSTKTKGKIKSNGEYIPREKESSTTKERLSYPELAGAYEDAKQLDY